MFKTIQRLYQKTKSKTVVRNAVLQNYITEEDYKKITGEDF